MKAKLNASIFGISCVIGENIVSLDSQVDIFYNGNLKKLNKIKNTIGLNTRCITSATTLDLAIQACKGLFKNIDKAEITSVIFVTQSPNYLQPNNASLLHEKFNLNESCACFDVNLGCSGYVYGLYLAYLMSPFNNKILLICGDTMSKCVKSDDSNTAPLFGDACSATIIQSGDSTAYFNLNTAGGGQYAILIVLFLETIGILIYKWMVERFLISLYQKNLNQ